MFYLNVTFTTGFFKLKLGNMNDYFRIFCNVFYLKLLGVKNYFNLRQIDFLLFSYHFDLASMIIIYVVKIKLIDPFSN